MLLVGEPCIGAEEAEALVEVIEGGWITMGDRVRAFEQAFAGMHATTEAVAVSSCTAGLHLVMQALGIGPGDEVLVPSLTFVATANCVLYVGAIPVFVDIEALEKPLMSRADASAKCTNKTRAIIVMHYAGYLADRDAWRDFALSRGLFLIEDAAHAAGADGVGSFGDAAVFSFYGNKNLTTAEGGMVLAHATDVLDRVRQLRNHGMTRTPHERRPRRTPTYDVTMLGYNYRMDEFRAAIGLRQLKHLAGWNKRRGALARNYRALLERRCPGVSVPFNDSSVSSHHILPIILPEGTDRQHVMQRMRDAGIETTIHYPPVHWLSLYSDKFPSVGLPQTEEFADRELTLPLHPKLEEGDVEIVTSTLANVLTR